MKKQLYLLYLLLLSVQLVVAQTTRYEYWLDNGYDGRTVVADNVDAVSLNLDISTIAPGLHFFNFRAQGDSERWGSLSRYLFFKREEADSTVSMAQYEYWLDNQHEMCTTVKGGTSEVLLNLDISSIKPGLHYFSFRAQGKSGQWGGLSRYLFFMREEADSTVSMAQYEYWLDNQHEMRTTVEGGTSEVLLNLDISSIKPGLHYLNFRAQGKSGQWGGLSRYLFFMKEEADEDASSMAQYEYWLDNNYDGRTIVNGASSDLALDLDVSSLKPGLHYFNVRTQGKSGHWGGLSRYLFFIKDNIGQLAHIEYWLDERQDVITQQVTDSTVVITMDISNLTGGDHTFYMEGVTSDGSRCMLNGYEFNVEFAPEPEPYAVLTTDSATILSQDSTGVTYGKTLTFYYDDQKEVRNGMSVGPFDYYGSAAWYDSSNYITKAVFDDSFANCTYLTNTAYWFYNCSKLSQIESIENLKTDNVRDMNSMFYDCSGLTSLNVSNFKTDNVTDMNSMFYNCSSLTNLDVSNFKTDNVTDMSGMFCYCSNLINLDVSKFKTDYVTNMRRMFFLCSSLTNLDVSNFNTANVTDMWDMFGNCSGLTSLDVSNFKTDNVTDMNSMFSGCSSLTNLDVSNFNTNNVTEMIGMFENCSGLTNLDVSKFKTDNVTSMWGLFHGCSNLTNLEVSNFKTDNVTKMHSMFSGCSSLTSLDVSKFKTDNVTDMAYMFSSCSGLTNLDVSNFNTNNVTDMGYMFSSCSGLTNLDVSNFKTDNVTNMYSMFSGCYGLSNLNVSNFKTDNVKNMHSMFSGCYGLTNLDVSNFKTDNVKNMHSMFSRCSSLTNLDVSNFKTDNVTSMDWMFSRCFELKTVYAGSGWSTEAVTESANMFTGSTKLVGGAGTLYDENHTDFTYAHIDGGTTNPGYFTDKNASLTTEPYVVLTTDTTSVLSSDSTGVTYGKTLTFYYDNLKVGRNGMNIGPFESFSERGWNSNADSITVVVFDDSFANCTTLTSTALWFSGCRNLKTIVGIENLKTDHVTTMFAMFDCCNSLTSLDVSKFNTENVTRMNDMFSDCRSLTSLDVTNFNTAKVTDMCDMFINCSSLTSLDVSNFKTDSVTNMSFMFIECSGLTSLDLSNFNTAKVTDMSKMFALCSGLKTIYVGEEWSTASVTNGTDMFKGCSAIKGGKGTTYSETFTIAYGNSTSSDYARIDYKGMPGYFTPKYGYTPEPTYTLEGNVLTIKAPIESSVYYVITDLYSDVDFESADSLRIPETLYTGPLTLDHPVRVRFMAVNGRIAHSEIIVVKYKPIEATFDGRVLAVGGSTTMTDALESVGGRDEVAKTITAIVWNSSATLSNSDLQGLDNPNLLIYVNERSLAPENRNNVVVNGLAMNVVLSDTGSGNCDFYAPQTFTAEMITYSREFKQATQVGVCRGWETISLPFMVQTIAHADNGVITPFGVDTSNKHFWLRQLSTNGLVSATKIEANLPYLISMPNDEKNYKKEYILKGLVTFSAQNAVVPKTEPTALALADSSVVMMPALQSVGKSSTVWALNVGQERSQYFEGSTFERDYREVRPFEAYTVHRSDSPAPRFLPINDLMNSATGIETISNVIMSHDNYYHIDGRKVDGKPTKKGLYITNGRKVVIK